MSRCVPNWDLSDPPPSATAGGRTPFHPSSAAHGVVPMLEYEVAELTWENGQLAMHGMGLPRPTGKIQGGGGSKYTWDNKPARASGTLESLINQGTGQSKIIGLDVTTDDHGGGTGLVPWFSDNNLPTPQSSTASAAITMDAMVPSNRHTVVDGCAGKAAAELSDNHLVAREDDEKGRKRRKTVARVVHATRERSSCRNQIMVNGSAALIGREIGQKVTLDTVERDFAAVAATSHDSLDDTNSGKRSNKTSTTDEDPDSVCHSTHQVEVEDEGDRKKGNSKSSISTKRSRAAATHNQSERKRRDRINERMRTLQKLVPNSNKTDKASMLDEVIEYLKQMQAQVSMMTSRINMPMMLPMAMQQQQQLQMASLMAPMGFASMGMPGMGMGLGMDHLNMISSRSGLTPGMSTLLHHPTAFVPVVTWDGAGTCNQLQPPPMTMMADPLSTFHAYQQSQPMTMEAYNRIAMNMFQQLHQHPPTTGRPNN